jgi:hypothetical protein
VQLKQIVILALLFVSQASIAADIIVMDYDDTIKVSHSQSKLDTVRRGLFSKALFAGAPENARAISKDGPITILSSSPTIFHHKIQKRMDQVSFPVSEIILRNWLHEKKADYKINHLRKLAADNSGQFILFGDDTESDPEIYQQFQTEFPGRTRAVFIHRVAGRAIPAGSHPFITWFDAATTEVQLGMIDVEDAVEVGKAILEADLSHVIPRFMVCSDLLSTEELPPKLRDIRSQISERLRQTCSGE